MQSYFAVPKNIRLNSAHYLKKMRASQIGFNHSSDIEFQDLMNIYRTFTAKPYLFLVIDATLASDNPFTFQKKSFRKNIKTNYDN